MDQLKVQYHVGDLFELARGKAKAHCVSADLEMGRGIALRFRDLYGRPSVLEEPQLGTVVTQGIRGVEQDFPIFALVTKEKYFNKPTVETLRAALISLVAQLKKWEIKELWIPKIGSGLDRLDWEKQVFPAIQETMKDWDGVLHIVSLE